MTPDDIEAVKNDVRDEAGSRLCAWDDNYQRVCTKDAGSSVCICENVARAAIACYEARLKERGMKVVAREPTNDLQEKISETLRGSSLSAIQVGYAGEKGYSDPYVYLMGPLDELLTVLRCATKKEIAHRRYPWKKVGVRMCEYTGTLEWFEEKVDEQNAHPGYQLQDDGDGSSGRP